jgi:protein involved in polysaccharide export with SLBB domain
LLIFTDEIMYRLIATSCALFLVVPSVGCSTLGFSTNPVAHTMTQQTKQVLNASPRRPVGVSRELDKQVLQTHYLEPGDELLIESNDIESLVRIPADQQVSADGSVDLGEYGRVKVASLTLEQAEELIQSAMRKDDQQPTSINVRLIQSVQKFYVIGEVNSPGSYPLTGHETVLDGIVAAGGLTQRASACDLLLARPTDPCSCRVTLPVCYRAITQLGDTATNYQLKPGDRVFVGRQSLWEELMQCCCWDRSCERCCESHRACRDPLVAQQVTPSFATPMTQSISSSMQPDVPESRNDAWPIQNQPLDSLHAIRVEAVPIAESATPGDAADAASPLDGELDFGDVLK